jgi:2-iminobutanoate/2-iminopropanoate deaminase
MSTYINDVLGAPKAIGPYSQAVQCGELLFLSGQIPLVPETGELVAGGIEAQTTQVLNNLLAVLRSQNLDFSAVLKTTIFVTDLAHFQSVNKFYQNAMGEARPARSTVQVSALPRGALVEIELIASMR